MGKGISPSTFKLGIGLAGLFKRIMFPFGSVFRRDLLGRSEFWRLLCNRDLI